MGIGSKYNNTADCGCSGTTGKTMRSYSTSGSCGSCNKNPCCCNDHVQHAPTPCCESHKTVYKFGGCLRPTCDVIASADGFFLSFSNLCEDLPVDTNNIFFYHPAAGQMKVTGVDGVSFQVELVDPTHAGGLIEKDSCVLIDVDTQSSFPNTTKRCLAGIFNVPAENDTSTINIENGSAIPTGSTLFFTSGGDTGSYVVTDYVSSSTGNIYTYKVQNTGNGHTAYTTIDGGCLGACIVPIEMTTEVDVCELSETTVIDTIAGCKNGSPRSLISEGANDIITGDGAGGWELSKATNLDCCVVTEGCLKFSGDTCSGGEDTVIIKDTNLSCFEEAWNAVDASNPTGAGQTKLPMNIDGFNVVVTAYNPSTKALTLSPANPDALDGETIITWDSGIQICLGNCCSSCLNGSSYSNHKLLTTNPLGEEYATVIPFNTNEIMEYEVGVRHHYLIGYDPVSPLTVVVKEIDSTYDDDPEGDIGKPVLADPLLFRHKVCNPSGCDKKIISRYNFEMAFHVVPAGVRIHWTIEDFIQGSKTLANGVTPNPFQSISSQLPMAGYIDGPSSEDANALIQQTSIGYGNKGDRKIFPYIAQQGTTIHNLEKCNCGLAITWFYVQTEVIDPTAGSGTISSFLNIRKWIEEANANETEPLHNDPSSEGFNN